MKINFWQALNNAQLTHPLTCGIHESKHAFVLKADILNTWLKLTRVEKQVNSIPREHLPQLIVFHRYELNHAVPEAATICLGHCKLTIASYLFARWHLFRYVGYIRHQQQVDLWPFDLESGIRVRCDWRRPPVRPRNVWLNKFRRTPALYCCGDLRSPGVTDRPASRCGTETWPDLRLKWPQVDHRRLDHIRLDLTWQRHVTWADFKRLQKLWWACLNAVHS